MATSPGVNLTVSPELVQPIIKEQIQAAIVAQLANVPNLIENIAMAALDQKVDSSGKMTHSSYDAKYSYMEYVSRQVIRAAAKDALTNWLEQNKKRITDAVESHLKRNTKSLAGQMVAACMGIATNGYKIELTIDKAKVY